MGAYMERSFSLAGYRSATLSFWYVIPSIDTGYDFFRVWIDNTLVFQRSSVVATWTQATIDLTPYVGGTHTVEFDFVSDSTLVAEGAYVDDILVTATQPDLTKGTDNLSSLTPHPGDTVTASLTIQNPSCGSASAGAFHVGFYWSASPAFNVLPFYETAVTGCPANGTVSVNQNITIDLSTAPGTYYLGYKIDDESEVAECNENNNGIYYWTVTVPATLADLVPQSISVSPNPATGGSVIVSYTVANQGGTAAPASHSKVQIKNSSNVLLTQQTFSTAGIPANSSTNESRSMSLTGASAGTYYAYVIVDNNGEVTQSNTSNDLSSGTAFTVQTQSGLVINPIFDSSITSDPQAATIEATINSAIAVYESNFSDLVTVTITFRKMANGLGASTRYYQTVLYSDYRAALVSHATTADDAAALAHLPAGSANPVNNNQNVNLELPLARALGFSAAPPARPARRHH